MALKRQWFENDEVEVGLDEAGRGSLWGRLYVGAVILSPEDEAYFDNGAALRAIKDSKKLTRRRRAILDDYIRENAIETAVAWSEPEEIDRLNILRADMAAMHRALTSFETPFQRILVDGDTWIPWSNPQTLEVVPGTTIIDGDAISLTIAAASILAKEAHDNWIHEMVTANPLLDERYGIGRNMGYGTAAHMAGLSTWGADTFHRRSFAPVKAVLPPATTPSGYPPNKKVAKGPLFR
jgi:ribonuclease HII